VIIIFYHMVWKLEKYWENLLILQCDDR
jgi:hypothetical protein